MGKTKLRVHGKNILGGWVEKIEGGVAKIFFGVSMANILGGLEKNWEGVNIYAC